MYVFVAKRDAVIAAVMVCLVAFSMLVPSDIYLISSNASDTLRVACTYVPFPCELGRSTSFPQISQTALLMSVVGAFLSAPSYLYWFMKGKRFDAVQENTKLMVTGWVFIVLALFPFYPEDGDSTPSRLEFLLLVASQSRIGLAFFSIIILIGELSLLLASAVWLKSLYIKYDK